MGGTPNSRAGMGAREHRPKSVAPARQSVVKTADPATMAP